MNELKKYKHEKLKTVGHLTDSWLDKRKTKPRIWVTKETLKSIKNKYYGKQNK
jgi:regulator of sigma D